MADAELALHSPVEGGGLTALPTLANVASLGQIWPLLQDHVLEDPSGLRVPLGWACPEGESPCQRAASLVQSIGAGTGTQLISYRGHQRASSQDQLPSPAALGRIHTGANRRKAPQQRLGAGRPQQCQHFPARAGLLSGQVPLLKHLRSWREPTQAESSPECPHCTPTQTPRLSHPALKGTAPINSTAHKNPTNTSTTAKFISKSCFAI